MKAFFLAPEKISAITAAQMAVYDDEVFLFPRATALIRANYRFRMAYLREATQQSWWHGTAEQLSTMRRLAQERFPDPYAPTDVLLVNNLPVYQKD